MTVTIKMKIKQKCGKLFVTASAHNFLFVDVAFVDRQAVRSIFVYSDEYRIFRHFPGMLYVSVILVTNSGVFLCIPIFDVFR